MASSDLIGKTLSHYDVVEPLGAGGMGVVYRAVDTRLNRSVAIKVLSEEFTADEHRKARFLQEARSASAVNHPAIAQIYEVDRADGIDFIAMELVEGRTVRKLVQDRELDVLGAVEIGIQIAEGLAKAHEAGIIHRDIKTDNVIVTPDGHAKILDFGLARPFTTNDDESLDPEATIQATLYATQAGMVVGTIGYMSPEQARSKPMDHRSDIFSLGIVLYEMVTGEMPFRGDSPLDTLHAIAFEETRPVTAVRSNLPPTLHRVVTRCLRKRAEDRYDSATAVAKDLRDVVREIDSGITGGIPLSVRLQDKFAGLGALHATGWLVPAVVLTLVALILVIGLSLGASDGITGLIPFALVGLLIYRRIRNRRHRLVKSFGKRCSKMEEIQLVSVQDPAVTVLVNNPLAKTYVRLNAMVEQMNNKLFHGEPFTLTVRESVADDQLRDYLESPGVVYVSESVHLPGSGPDTPAPHGPKAPPAPPN